MRYLLLLAVLGMVGAQSAEAGPVLVVQKQLRIQTKKGDLVLQAGTYAAKIDVDSDEIEMEVVIAGKKREIKFKTPKNKDQKWDHTKIQVKAEDIKEDFDLVGKTYDNVKVTGPEKTVARSCVIKSWTTQENCQVVSRWEGGSFCGFMNEGPCQIPGKYVQSIDCDTVTHTIDGTQLVTFIPQLEHHTKWISFNDARTNEVLAEFIFLNSKYTSEKSVFSTSCKM